MPDTSNLIGTVIATCTFLVVILAGAAGQLFTVSGSVGNVPAYGTVGSPDTIINTRYVDPVTYDEQRNVLDFKKISGRISGYSDSPQETCIDRRYFYELRDQKIWKKGWGIDAVKRSLHDQLGPMLQSCAAPAGMILACSGGCTAKGEDRVIVTRPFQIQMNSANAYAPGVLQFILTVNGSCMRTMDCEKSGS